jgi:hypothetical protein
VKAVIPYHIGNADANSCLIFWNCLLLPQVSSLPQTTVIAIAQNQMIQNGNVKDFAALQQLAGELQVG